MNRSSSPWQKQVAMVLMIRHGAGIRDILHSLHVVAGASLVGESLLL